MMTKSEADRAMGFMSIPIAKAQRKLFAAKESKHAAGRTPKRADKPRDKRIRKAADKSRSINRGKGR